MAVGGDAKKDRCAVRQKKTASPTNSHIRSKDMLPSLFLETNDVVDDMLSSLFLETNDVDFFIFDTQMKAPSCF